MTRQLRHLKVGLSCAACATVLVVASFAAPAAVAPNNPPDLSLAPPDTSLGVNPNIFVTLDDSGSMTSNYMGDSPPYGGSSWGNKPWFSANVIDPDHGSATDAKLRALDMNGVYFNPKTTYAPPIKEDGSLFPPADATLANVQRDGIACNRPWSPSPITCAATGSTQKTNQDSGGSANDNQVDNLTGTNNYTITYQCKTRDSSNTCVNASQLSGYPKINNGTDNRWGSGSSGTTTTSPMDGQLHMLSDGTLSQYGPAGTASIGNTTSVSGGYQTIVTYSGVGGGPYYWRYKQVCASSVTAKTSPPMGDTIANWPASDGNCAPAWSASSTNGLNAYGKPTGTDVTNLYTAGYWEAVPVANTGSKWQNFANWYSYYRTRNLMTRTALSRVFGVIGTPQKSSIRVSWQNLGLKNRPNWQYSSNGTTAISGTQIVELDDTSTVPTAAPYSGDGSAANTGWRQAFFNWIFNTGASTNTPSLHAMMRVGDFFTKGKGTYNLTNPYYQPGGSGKIEVACRQNYHMFVTDGFYNETSPNNSADTNKTWTLPANPSGITAYNSTDAVSKIYAHPGWDNDQSNSSAGTYSDVAFQYWATNLRPDFSDPASTTYTKDTVPPYFADLTTGVATASATVDASNPGATPEVFWNPVNDPATWPHLVQFAVTLGAYGKLINSTHTDCKNGATTSNDDGCALRKGASPLSNGGTTWPQPQSSGGNDPGTVDDMWHAALNSRGQFFVASNPQNLVTRLTKILTNIVSRSGSQVSESVNSSILNQGSVAYQGGYNSSGWPGYLYYQKLDPNTGAPLGTPVWDAGCLLTLGTCSATSTATTSGTTGYKSSTSRVLFTSTASGSGASTTYTGVPFQWASLGSNEQLALNLDPTTTWPDQVTSLVVNGGAANGTQDANGQDRLNYLRGLRKNETTPTTSATNPTTFRPRISVLGAIIDSQAVYEGGPSGGWQDTYPAGSPEAVAAASGTTYASFVSTNLYRNSMIYAGANDGMLHAFDAISGTEVWGYVPNVLYSNGALDQYTNPANSGLVPSVDDTPITQDVFLTKDSKWHTMLVGSLRLGGRGVYALDVTDTSVPASESAAAGKFMWEFTSAQDSDLGYSYSTTNIARIRCNVSPCHGAVSGSVTTGGTWVVLVTSGYFPGCLPAANNSPTCTANGNAATDKAAGATSKASGPTYLWVLNADDGSVIAKIPTPTTYKGKTITSYGLGTPGVVDFGLDQIDDVVAAGDLAGNLFRFDLTDPNPANWSAKVDVMFQTYTSASACGTGNTSGFGCEPITVMPVAFPDSTTGSVIYVFGSGQYLGASDNTTASVYTTQHFFGVRDYGTASANYPLLEANLDSRALTQDASGIRSLPFAVTAAATSTPKAGWMIPLNVTPTGGSGILGERNVATASPLYSAGIAVLTSLIPGQNLDPCQPGRSGAVIMVDASSGGPPLLSAVNGGSSAQVGTTVTNPPTVGGLSIISLLGGGSVVLPGMGANGGKPPQLNGAIPIWRRTSWDELLNQM